MVSRRDWSAGPPCGSGQAEPMRLPWMKPMALRVPGRKRKTQVVRTVACERLEGRDVVLILFLASLLKVLPGMLIDTQ